MTEHPAPLPCFIDVEASGIAPDSYPVEVAWSKPDGSVTDCLIAPVDYWTHWDANAEAIHGIPRELAVREGESVERVTLRLNAALGQVGVAYSDASALDGWWLDVLFEAAGLLPEFRVAPAIEVFPDTTLAALEGYKEAAYQRIGGQRHRAETDVRALLEAYRLASQGAGQR
ncbi:hypothetical protein [Sediminicurvatus halobius]|uniref:Exonuclease domain-containing protein n=1 Tax=Sediminicurvatus halobius TaxID=2182432 RepID=A0A2U2MXB6_9GAMM|nr:hypothetical protein [Spiribacter halobius]PWG61472.1 hypothetical protein DEM34_16375 [Spiribacter halobius]UEX77258.1 hypothetical protein LMH63_15095 [Spiribacter halobius]